MGLYSPDANMYMREFGKFESLAIGDSLYKYFQIL